jgi:glycosyltransferase involved in cell wall biosynthesis
MHSTPLNPPRVLAVLPGLFPSTIINVAKPLLRLDAEGRIDLTLTFQFVVRRRQVEHADVLILCHTIDPAHAHILDVARELRTPVIYDIDENLLEPPPGEPGLEFHAAPPRQAAVRRCLEQAALVRTYSPVLKRYLDRFNPEIVRVDGPVDWTLLSGQAPPHADRLQIVYATSRVDDAIGRALVAPLGRIVAARPDVDVTIWGPRLSGLDGLPRVQHRGFIRDYDRFFREFAHAGFDIGLAPMPADVFYQCKTATKFREYAACRIAGVYADVEMYRDCVTDGVTGLLAPANDDAWVTAIGRLIDDTELRRRIQDRGEAYARERYGSGRIESEWLSHITQVIRDRSTATVSGAIPDAAATSAPSPTLRLQENATNRTRSQEVRLTEAAARSSHASGSGRTSIVALIAGLVRQGLRHAARVPSLLHDGGVAGVWARTRGQLAGIRQLVAWELALRRMQRQSAVAPEPTGARIRARKAP